ncbi:tubulin-folding cofactor A isoform X2 [Jatropha curcas]|uniref:tubulin-folding cofactor A isoform X2 n=1 Tax=Jatropha curcas TaxID=180498 RepID=UPI001895803A|nr:tubulin-folding cofactor A isoform X2 [Jatropha curcas]
MLLNVCIRKMATLRNLKIKTSTCKRIVKELHSYEKEVEREAAKTADMKEKGADPYDLKQQENVLAESRMMIPDCHKRLEAALADLKGTLVVAGVCDCCSRNWSDSWSSNIWLADKSSNFFTESLQF